MTSHRSQGPAESARWPSGTSAYSGFGPLLRVHGATALQASSRQEVLSRRARKTLWRLAVAYGCVFAFLGPCQRPR